jgi:hypothetical protein
LVIERPELELYRFYSSGPGEALFGVLESGVKNA